MENKQIEKSKYSLKSTVIAGKLKLKLKYERSIHHYIGLYDAELLKTCGFPANLCTDLRNVSNFLMSAKYGVTGIQFIIDIGEGSQTATISVFQEVGEIRILDIKLKLEQKPRDRCDILEEEIRMLNSELMSAKTGNETLTERVNKLEQIMLTNDLQTEIDRAMPKGSIIMWSGSIDDIPTGWQLCDGSDGAPDLRNKFIVGAGGKFSTNKSGDVMDGHRDATINAMEKIVTYRYVLAFRNSGMEGYLLSHLPPYYSLCFIVKVS